MDIIFCTATSSYVSRVSNGEPKANTRVKRLKCILPPDSDTSPMFIHVHTKIQVVTL